MIDGDHSEEVSTSDFVDYFPLVKDGGVIWLDDIAHAAPVGRTWEKIKKRTILNTPYPYSCWDWGMGHLEKGGIVESPACGTISMIPHHFPELDGYFPAGTYVVCKTLDNASKIMKNMSPEEFCNIQQKAYEHVMKYHTSNSRISYLLDLIGGKSVNPFEYGQM